MATSIQSVSGINEDLIPIQIPVDNKMYKLLVKQSAIPLISNRKYLAHLYFELTEKIYFNGLT